MKRLHALFVCVTAVLIAGSAVAQCSGGCPSGSVTTLPTGVATLAPGTTYCISTTTDLSANTYTVNGTLVIQAGTVTLRDVIVNKTGVIQVKFGARLIITGVVNGNNVAPASTIDNIVICNGGWLNITGSFSQGEINIAVNDFGVLQITGAWTAGATDATVKIGTGSLIELCSSFNMNKDGFFIETGSGVSYLVVHAPMMQSVVNGYLSNLKSASHIKFTADAGAAYVSHPAAYTCNACGNYNLAPTGTSNVCGSAASAQNSIVLPTTITGFYKKAGNDRLQIIAQVNNALPITAAVLQSSSDGVQFMATGYAAQQSSTATTTTYTYTLPLQENGKYYRVGVEMVTGTLYSTVLTPDVQSSNDRLLVYSSESGDAVWVQLPAEHAFTSMVMFNNCGQPVYHCTVGASAGLVQYHLPASLQPGVYFVKLTGARGFSVTRLLKKG